MIANRHSLDFSINDQQLHLYQNYINKKNEREISYLMALSLFIYYPTSVLSGQFQKAEIRKVIFPSTVEYIDENSFSGNQTITEVVIPQSVSLINDLAFTKSISLTKVTIPDTAYIYLSNRMIDFFFSDARLSLISNLQDIKSTAFKGCDNLLHVSIYKKRQILIC